MPTRPKGPPPAHVFGGVRAHMSSVWFACARALCGVSHQMRPHQLINCQLFFELAGILNQGNDGRRGKKIHKCMCARTGSTALLAAAGAALLMLASTPSAGTLGGRARVCMRVALRVDLAVQISPN